MLSMTSQPTEEQIELWKNTTVIAKSFSKIEDAITDLIGYYFSDEKKRGQFKKVILKNETYARKYEIFKTINENEKILNDTVIRELPKMARIRNAILHDNIETNGKYFLKLEGDLKEYTFEELFTIYKNIYKLVFEPISNKLDSYSNIEEIKIIIGDLAYVEVVLRNYKGWFMDIVELKIYDSEGKWKTIDYPEYEYNVENYEEEVEKTISEFLSDKYGIAKGTYDIESDCQFSETDDN